MKIRLFFILFVYITSLKYTNLRVMAISKKPKKVTNPLIFTFIIVKHTN